MTTLHFSFFVDSKGGLRIRLAITSGLNWGKGKSIELLQVVHAGSIDWKLDVS